MRHQPTKLALLISLIGVSGTSYAFGGAWPSGPVAIDATVTGEAAEGSVPSLADTQLQSAARIDAGTRARAIAAVQRITSQETRPSGESEAADVGSVTWLQAHRPGFDPLDDFVATFVRAQASQPSSQVATKQLNPVSVTPVLAAARNATTAATANSSRSPDESPVEPPQSPTVQIAPQPASTAATAAADTPVRAVATTAVPLSSQTARVIDSLAAIMLDDIAVLGGPATHKRIAERFPGWIDQTTAVQKSAASTGQMRALVSNEPRRILVGTQTTQVLSNLQRVLSASQGELQTLDGEAPELVVASQAEKVLASLSDLRERSGKPSVSRAPRAAVPPMRAEVRSTAGDVAAGFTTTSALHGQAHGPTARASSGLANGGVDIGLDLAIKADAHAALDIDLSQPALDIDLSQPMPMPMPVADSAILAAALASMPEAVPSVGFNDSPFGGATVAVSETSLDGVRGGFVANGLNISFGIERAVYINGALVTSTRLNVSELGKVTGGAGSAPMDTATLGIVQSGAGNTFTAGTLSSSTIGTVVQNTLDGQSIKNLTVINATANSLGVLKGLNLESSLRGAVIDSLRR